jgi:hypothetical protein
MKVPVFVAEWSRDSATAVMQLQGGERMNRVSPRSAASFGAQCLHDEETDDR